MTALEVEEYSHFGMVARYTAGAANLPFMPLRSYFETDLPEANPLIREIASPYGDGTVYAVPPLKPDVDDRPRAARRRERQHPGLGPARLPEGGGVRRRPGDRRGRGAGRRGGDPRRPQPHDHPGPDRGRRGRRAVRRPSLVRPGRLRPRQPLLPRLGPDQPRRGRAPGVAPRVGLRPRRRAYVEKLGERVASLSPAAPSGSVDYGSYG